MFTPKSSREQKVGYSLFRKRCARIPFHLRCSQVGLLQQAALGKQLPSRIEGARQLFQLGCPHLRQLFQLGCPHLRQLFQLGCSIRTNVIILVILELIPFFFRHRWKGTAAKLYRQKRRGGRSSQHHELRQQNRQLALAPHPPANPFSGLDDPRVVVQFLFLRLLQNLLRRHHGLHPLVFNLLCPTRSNGNPTHAHENAYAQCGWGGGM